ncbi:hypothetical protein D8L93_09610, partial [Sodalis-like symbiont of Bactericera trigonica]
EEEGPLLGDWQRDPAAPHTPYDFTVEQQNSGALTAGAAAAGQGGTPLTFMPALSASGNDYNPAGKIRYRTGADAPETCAYPDVAGTGLVRDQDPLAAALLSGRSAG